MNEPHRSQLKQPGRDPKTHMSREEMGRRIRGIHDGIAGRKIGVNADGQPYSTINLAMEILGERKFRPKEW